MSEPAGPLLLVPDRLVDGTGGPARTGLGVLVEDGRIAAVDRLAAFAASSAKRVDHPGATLLPGLIDGHVHLELTPGPDHATTLETWERDLAAGRLGMRAAAHARAALAAGITTLRDAGSSLAILAVRDALAGRGMPGPRLLVSGPPVTTPGGHCHWFGGEAAGDEAALRRRVAALCEAGVDAVKVMASGGIMTPGSDAGARQYDAAALAVIVDEAHRRGRPVVAHANATVSIGDALVAGADVIDHLGWLDAAGAIAPDAALIAELGARRHACGMTTSGIVRGALAEGEAGARRLRERFADKAALHAAGARLHLHSDAGVRLTVVDRPDLGLATAAAGTGLPLPELLATMTGQAAAAVGLGGDVGVIRVGARADLLLVDGDPTQDPGALRAVREVRRDGRVVVRRAADGGLAVAA